MNWLPSTSCKAIKVHSLHFYFITLNHLHKGILSLKHITDWCSQIFRQTGVLLKLLHSMIRRVNKFLYWCKWVAFWIKLVVNRTYMCKIATYIMNAINTVIVLVLFQYFCYCCSGKCLPYIFSIVHCTSFNAITDEYLKCSVK